MAGQADRVANWFDDAFSPKSAIGASIDVSAASVAVDNGVELYRVHRDTNDVSLNLPLAGLADRESHVFRNSSGAFRTYVNSPAGQNILDPVNGLVNRIEVVGLGSQLALEWNATSSQWEFA